MSNLQGALVKIGSSSQFPSVPEVLFREYVRGQISKADYEIQTAVWVGDSTREYGFRPYPILPAIVIEYARARVSRVRENRDPAMHRRLGTWTQMVRLLAEQNDADRSLLVWCLEKLQARGLTKHVNAIQQKLTEYESIIPDHLELSHQAQILDSEEKAREEGRR